MLRVAHGIPANHDRFFELCPCSYPTLTSMSCEQIGQQSCKCADYSYSLRITLGSVLGIVKEETFKVQGLDTHRFCANNCADYGGMSSKKGGC